jgi:hypothetical protein
MVKVRAKFRCIERKIVCVPQYTQAEGAEETRANVVVLQAVSDPVNKGWALATPAGRVELTLDNPDAWGAFRAGQFYYVEFYEAPMRDDGPGGRWGGKG